ncbi:cytochrome c biogenesis CcdA family protein [Deinococcus cellulosilyticus]|uniref:Electron transporter n=1 Tax=Deinococcus cellulosilyticus (strain DSM 18568 / NBRC 106333 / KACC 11606 / 5516J-15) TaxID=1223518 RepID=A0A511N1B9_DEIC1|nr:cytochrome c biogenesis protein CcdA [Deinococcus cellulosilyticus]GEM46674.1 electron transporter [Deinococcus cellulosilyticus NBRC 106333 = KACC 11606]
MTLPRFLSRWAPLALVLSLLPLGMWLAVTREHTLPSIGWLQNNKPAALLLTTTTGFADGVNPCAITTLLLFIGALMHLVGQHSQTEVLQARRRIWGVAFMYILGIFLLYFLLGTGFIQIAWLQTLGNTHLFTRIAGMLAVLLGVIMSLEHLFPDSPIRLTMPGGLHSLARTATRHSTLPGAFIGGVLIGTCTIPCGGAMYLAIAAVIASLTPVTYAYTLLLTYNVAFVLPLVLLVTVASSRTVLQRVSRLHLTHKRQVKLTLGVFVILVGFLSLL